VKTTVLFYTFLGVFVLTAIVTLLGVLGIVSIQPTHLSLLLSAFLIELAAAVVGLFKRTDFSVKESSISATLSFAVDSFDRLSDEIEAAINNRQAEVNRAHRFLIRRFGNSVAAYQRMQEFSDEHFDQLPSEVRRRIRTYHHSMRKLEREWELIKREHPSSQLQSDVREKQLSLIKGMKEDLVGIVDVLQAAGFYVNDHYLNVRSLVSQL
jgi:hypothetical protein